MQPPVEQELRLLHHAPRLPPRSVATPIRAMGGQTTERRLHGPGSTAGILELKTGGRWRREGVQVCGAARGERHGVGVGLDLLQESPRQDDHTRGAVTNFLVLRL